MAKNRVQASGSRLGVVTTDPSSPASGDPVLFGQLPGVCLVDKRTSDNITAMQTNGVFNLSVKGVDGSGNHAIAAGDIVYYVTADTPKLSAKATGVRFGIAMDPVNSAATTTIRVRVG